MAVSDKAELGRITATDIDHIAELMDGFDQLATHFADAPPGGVRSVRFVIGLGTPRRRVWIEFASRAPQANIAYSSEANKRKRKPDANADTSECPLNKRRRDDNQHRWNVMGGGSSVAHPGEFRDINIPRNYLVLGLRPPEAYGPPITLFHPDFDKFLHTFRDTSQAIEYPSYDDLRKFTFGAAALYSTVKRGRRPWPRF